MRGCLSGVAGRCLSGIVKITHFSDRARGRLRDRLLDLEEELLDPEVRSSRPRLEEILDDAFTEIGASGCRYSREAAIVQLTTSGGPRTPAASASVGSIEDFRILWRRGPAVLVAYRFVITASDEPPRFSHRSSLWVRRAGAWRIVHHQGTPV